MGSASLGLTQSCGCHGPLELLDKIVPIAAPFQCTSSRCGGPSQPLVPPPCPRLQVDFPEAGDALALCHPENLSLAFLSVRSWSLPEKHGTV